MIGTVESVFNIFPLSRCSMWIYCPVGGLVGTDWKLREMTFVSIGIGIGIGICSGAST